jgi:hypothetical protein
LWQNTCMPLGQGPTVAIVTLPTNKTTVFYRLYRPAP